ncbi:MAG TPA: zinc ribbon domain-containing protein [Pyrinomonadaceae bacterium]|nr:zinc ribbon domain-containing protein [Pyrinomonadaceae bacterium]
MSEPEIARRCTSCGLSVRKSAMFCPQCGNPISQTTNSSQTAPTQVLDPEPNPISRSGVAENVRERVEKIRHVSSVVIDQAAYDPSLRFLLVAAALFLLFVVLVILSKVVG